MIFLIFIFSIAICGIYLLFDYWNSHSITLWAHKKLKCVLIIFEPPSLPQFFWIFYSLHPSSTSKNWYTRNQHHIHHHSIKLWPCVMQNFGNKWSQNQPVLELQRKKGIIFHFNNYNLPICTVNFCENWRTYCFSCIFKDFIIKNSNRNSIFFPAFCIRICSFEKVLVRNLQRTLAVKKTNRLYFTWCQIFALYKL